MSLDETPDASEQHDPLMHQRPFLLRTIPVVLDIYFQKFVVHASAQPKREPHFPKDVATKDVTTEPSSLRVLVNS